jgi:hypothetical protein
VQLSRIILRPAGERAERRRRASPPPERETRAVGRRSGRITRKTLHLFDVAGDPRRRSGLQLLNAKCNESYVLEISLLLNNKRNEGAVL